MFLSLTLLTIEVRKGCPTGGPGMSFPDRICGCKIKKYNVLIMVGNFEQYGEKENYSFTPNNTLFFVAIMLLLIILHAHVN